MFGNDESRFHKKSTFLSPLFGGIVLVGDQDGFFTGKRDCRYGFRKEGCIPSVQEKFTYRQWWEVSGIMINIETGNFT